MAEDMAATIARQMNEIKNFCAKELGEEKMKAIAMQMDGLGMLAASCWMAQIFDQLLTVYGGLDEYTTKVFATGYEAAAKLMGILAVVGPIQSCTPEEAPEYCALLKVAKEISGDE